MQVTVFIPCYNEAKKIQTVLDALAGQTFPLTAMQVIVVDGMSTDATREKIQEFCRDHPEVNLRVVDNPDRTIPKALNIGCREAAGEIIVRMDAHSAPNQDYVEKCVTYLLEEKGDNVGGRWRIQPGEATATANAIAFAAGHPMGSGGANYRSGNQATEVDTVPFGAFFRSTWERVGPFDESLLANEDYEWNYRLRQSGGRIYFAPDIECEYFARSVFGQLARQYFNYGFWKRRMLAKHPESLRLRQLLPVLLFFANTSGLVLILLGLIAGQPLLLLPGLLPWLGYGALLVLGLAGPSKRPPFRHFHLVMIACFLIHHAWAAGFLVSCLKKDWARASANPKP